jgi:hypothetical protein
MGVVITRFYSLPPLLSLFFILNILILSISWSFKGSFSISGKWKCIIDLFNEDAEEGNDTFYDQLYLWVRPSEDNLHFIKEHTVNAGCCQLVSIGCGSGLLEWLIQTATGRNTNFLNNDFYNLGNLTQITEVANDVFNLLKPSGYLTYNKV